MFLFPVKVTRCCVPGYFNVIACVPAHIVAPMFTQFLCTSRSSSPLSPRLAHFYNFKFSFATYCRKHCLFLKIWRPDGFIDIFGQFTALSCCLVLSLCIYRRVYRLFNHYRTTGRCSGPSHYDVSIRQAARAAFVTSSFKIFLTQTFPRCGATCYILPSRAMTPLFNGVNFVYRSVEVYLTFCSYL